jgi:hypothetical protein
MARGAFWTIIVDEQPTAFRAPLREDLLPTLTQLQRQHPTAVIKWFQRGRLWETPGDAMDAGRPPRRPGAWRPGGEHKDPRDQYKVPRDVKRARWASQAADGRGPWVKGQDRAPAPSGERPPRRPFVPRDRESAVPTGAPREPRAERPAGDRPAWKPRAEGSRSGSGFRGTGTGSRPPREDRPSGDRPAWKPKGDGNAERSTPNAEGRPAWKPKAEGSGSGYRDSGTGTRPASAKGFGAASPTTGTRPPRVDRASGDRPAWKPKGDGNAEGRPAWKPKAEGSRSGSVYRGTGTGSRPASGKGFGTPSPTTGTRPPREDRPSGDRPAWKPKGDGNADGRPAWKPKAEGSRSGSGYRGTGTASRPPREDRPSGDRPAWKPKAEGSRPASAKGFGATRPTTGTRPPREDRPSGDRPAWKPKGDGNAERRTPNAEGRPAWKPKSDRPAGDRTGWKPAGDRPRSGAPRSDWRGDRNDRRDATPRAGGDAPKPAAAKKGRTWRAGELPPADRKKKKSED